MPIVRECLMYLVVLLLGMADIKIWRDATTYSPTQARVEQQYKSCWQLDGQKKCADHITTTDPNYLGLGYGMTVVGFDSENQLLWSVNKVGSIHKVEE